MNSNLPQGSIRDLVHFVYIDPLADDPVIFDTLTRVYSQGIDFSDLKRWDLTTNENLLVKSFYRFLNNRSIYSQVTQVILKGLCPRKINMLNLVAWDNSLPTTTCVLCH